MCASLQQGRLNTFQLLRTFSACHGQLAEQLQIACGMRGDMDAGLQRQDTS